jgi:hypothetical protein
MRRPTERTAVRVSRVGQALQALTPPEQLKGITADLELVDRDERVHLRIGGSRLEVDSGPVPNPDALLMADPRTMFAIAAGSTSLAIEESAGRITIDGGASGRRALERVLRLPR